VNNAFLLTLDTLNFREWSELTSNTKKCIDFCQHVSLLGTHLVEYMWRRCFDERPFEYIIRSVQEK
jgi:hypothetical protein